MSIGAALVTKGGYDISEVLQSIPWPTEVYDNSRNEDQHVYGRYLAAAEIARDHEYIYTQDDDCLLDYASIDALHSFGVGQTTEAVRAMEAPSLPWSTSKLNVILCNMPVTKRAEYPGRIQLLGWGAVFHRDCLQVFERYWWRWPRDDFFRRVSDRIFTGLCDSRVLLDLPFQHLPRAYGSDRMGAQPTHLGDLAEARRRVQEITGEPG